MKPDPKTIIDVTQDHSLSKNVVLPTKSTNNKPLVEYLQTPDKKVSIKKYHWEKDRFDSRDFAYKVTKRVQPNYVDLREQCSVVEQQGQLGSCVGNTIAGAIELLYNRNNKPSDISRLFIYYYSRFFINTVHTDSGARIRDAIKSVYTYGAPLERLWPYDISKFRMKPNKQAMEDALSRKVTRYERITNHEGCLDALANGFPVSVGFNVYSSFESDIVRTTGVMPYPQVSRERYLGGHAVLLVGYDKQRQVYIARNSWGADWGDRGYFYMPFRVIQNNRMSDDFWVIKTVTIK